MAILINSIKEEAKLWVTLGTKKCEWCNTGRETVPAAKKKDTLYFVLSRHFSIINEWMQNICLHFQFICMCVELLFS
jgi:hypothetical protein